MQAYPHGMEWGCIGDEEVCSQAAILDHICCWQASSGNSKVNSIQSTGSACAV